MSIISYSFFGNAGNCGRVPFMVKAEPRDPGIVAKINIPSRKSIINAVGMIIV
jgi:hypothetical protein